jgi:integrase
MLVGLLASTRLRSGEALRLDRTDVDFDMSTGGRGPHWKVQHPRAMGYSKPISLEEKPRSPI